MTFAISRRGTTLHASLAGTAPPGTEGYCWAELAIKAFHQELDVAGIQSCEVDLSQLKYIAGDFIMEFVIPPALMKSIPTKVLGGKSIQAAFQAMTPGLPNFTFELVAE